MSTKTGASQPTSRQRAPIYRGGGSAPQPVRNPAIWRLVIWVVIWTAIAIRFYQPGKAFVNWYTSVFWTIPVGVSLIGLAGWFLVARKIIAALPKLGEVNVLDSPLEVTIITKGSNDIVGALTRVVRSTAVLDHYFKHYSVAVVTDEGCEAMSAIEGLVGSMSNVRLTVVPEWYATAKGTQFKARASQYALEQLQLHYNGQLPYDHFDFHLDDDTAMELDTAREIARFITQNTTGAATDRHLVQGLLTYPVRHSPNLWLWLADAIRPWDDIARFPLTTGRGTPRAGLHGECLLLRTSVEAQIGWDFGPGELVEDSRFALEFCKQYPSKSAWAPIRVYGASPVTAHDFVFKQRARWSEGMTALMFNREIPLKYRALIMHNMLVWAVGIFQPAVIVFGFSVLFWNYNVSPVTMWLVPLWVVSVSYTYWGYWEGLRQNAYASGMKGPKLIHKILLVPGILYFSILEGAGGTIGAFKHFRNGKNKKFEGVNKPH